MITALSVDRSSRTITLTSVLGASASTYTKLTIACVTPGDSTPHDVTVVLDQGKYVWTVDQSASASTAASYCIAASDGSKHALAVVLDQGKYVLEVDQTVSTLAAQTIYLQAADSSNHLLSIVLDQLKYVLSVAQ